MRNGRNMYVCKGTLPKCRNKHGHEDGKERKVHA